MRVFNDYPNEPLKVKQIAARAHVNGATLTSEAAVRATLQRMIDNGKIHQSIQVLIRLGEAWAFLFAIVFVWFSAMIAWDKWQCRNLLPFVPMPSVVDEAETALRDSVLADEAEEWLIAHEAFRDWQREMRWE